MPLLNVDTRARAPYERLSEYPSASEDDDSVLDVNDGDGPPGKKKRWWMYIPLLLLVVMMFAPQYSILVMLVSYYLSIHDSPFLFTIHLAVIYLLTFLACCSLLVCVVRDPGAIRIGEDAKPLSDAEDEDEIEDDNEETDMMDALRMAPTTSSNKGMPRGFDDDFNAPHKWCRKCWAPKPERTHHCSSCGRCVLKMDHHCPWLAQKCVGYWTYTAFLHFLFCITLLSVYVGFVAGWIVYVAFLDPFLVNERTALHALFLTLYGAIFSLVVGSFFLWHVYLASTNQTTIENISPFLLLRYLPNLTTRDPISVPRVTSNTETGITSPLATPDTTDSVSLNSPNPSNPPIAMMREHQLNASQRRTVRYYHGKIRLYDVGFRANWGQLLGVGADGSGRKRVQQQEQQRSGTGTGTGTLWRWRWRRILYRILCGGAGAGDGRTFPRNPKAERLLVRLAEELAREDKID